MIKALVAAFLLALPGFCRAETKSFSDFSGGLNTRQSSVLIQENESPDLQNVVLDEAGAITRRRGFTKLNSAAIGGGLSDVNAVYQLEKSNGDKYCVAFSSTNGYYSTNGCNTFTTFISTLTRNNDVNCDAYADRLYCVNNQYDFYFDGTNDITFAGPANANYIRAWRNRCFAAGTDASPSRLYWSDLGDCNTWNALSYVDIDAEDGDVITGIGPDLFNFLPIYKKFSTYLIQFDNANTANRKVINVSRTTGAKNHRAIVSFNNRQYFLSVGPNGGQPGVYSTDGILMDESSGKIRSEVESLSNSFSNSGRKMFDTKAEWESGTYDPYAMSASRDPGFMQSSYTLVAQTLSSDFGIPNMENTMHVSTHVVPGSLTLSVASGTFENGGFQNATAACSDTLSSTDWPTQDGVWVTGRCDTTINLQGPLDGTLGGTQRSVKSPATAIAEGGSYRASVNVLRSYDDTVLHTYSLAGAGGSIYSIDLLGTQEIYDEIRLKVTVPGGISIVSKSFKTPRTLYFTYVRTGANPYYGIFDFVENSIRYSSGTYTSQIFDLVISTPVGGQFSSTATISSGETGLVYYIRESSMSNNTAWGSYVEVTDTSRISTSKRYQQFKSVFTTSVSTKTPRVDAYSFSGASTGVWTSPETFLSNTVATWGTLQATEVKTGAGAITYVIKASTYSGGTAYAPWKSISSGDTISVDTGAYVVVRATFSVYSASETAKLDSLVINWNEGTSAKSATMAVYKNRLHFCGQTAAGTYNDVCYVLDTKGAWTKWTGVNARHLNVVNQNFTAASSPETSSGYVYKLYDSDSDDGAGISAYWASKDHPLGNIQNRKAVDRFFVVGSPDATTLTATIQADTGLRSLSYDIDFSTGMAFKISHKPVQGSINGNVFRMKFSNTEASKPWSVLGYGMQYRDLGLTAP